MKIIAWLIIGLWFANFCMGFILEESIYHKAIQPIKAVCEILALLLAIGFLVKTKESIN